MTRTHSLAIWNMAGNTPRRRMSTEKYSPNPAVLCLLHLSITFSTLFLLGWTFENLAWGSGKNENPERKICISNNQDNRSGDSHSFQYVSNIFCVRLVLAWRCIQTAEDKTLTSRVLNNPDSQISDTPQGRHQEASKMSSSPEASHRSGAKSHTLTALAQIRTASVGSCYALPCLAFSQQVHRQSRTRSRQLPVLKGRPFKTHTALLRHCTTAPLIGTCWDLDLFGLPTLPKKEGRWDQNLEISLTGLHVHLNHVFLQSHPQTLKETGIFKGKT